jgi:hypothetical protein
VLSLPDLDHLSSPGFGRKLFQTDIMRYMFALKAHLAAAGLVETVNNCVDVIFSGIAV